MRIRKDRDMEFLLWFVILCVVALIVVIAISIYENKRFQVQIYEVSSSKLPPSFVGMKAVFLSDLHNQEFGEGNQKLIDAIHQINPDLVLCGGDILVGKPGASIEPAVKLVKALCKEYPVYMALGNHEYRLQIYPEQYGTMWQEYEEATKAAGAIWLDNESVSIAHQDGSIRLTGLSIEREYYQRCKRHEMVPDYIVGLCASTDEYQILLAHNPQYFDAYAEYGADLVLSGHVHGGMVRIPFLGGVISPMLILFPHYDRGEYKKGDSTMILSAGLGNHTIKFRVNNLPELSVIQFVDA